MLGVGWLVLAGGCWLVGIGRLALAGRLSRVGFGTLALAGGLWLAQGNSLFGYSPDVRGYNSSLSSL